MSRELYEKIIELTAEALKTKAQLDVAKERIKFLEKELYGKDRGSAVKITEKK